jgi:large subunit ribosomal protein L15
MNLAKAKTLGIKREKAYRVGRGVGSGSGKTSGRGHKGAKARSGWSQRVGWEGGQMPLYRRIPKRGFNNKNFKKVYTIVNVDLLNHFEDGTTVDLAAVLHAGLVSKEKGSEALKVLGNGELTRKLTVRAGKFSAMAREKIEKAGGVAEASEASAIRPRGTKASAKASATAPATGKGPDAAPPAGEPGHETP